MPYFHFCLSCRQRLYTASRMSLDRPCPECGGRLMPYHLVRGPGPTARVRARGRSYASLADFYGGDPRRIASGERDVGLYWRGDDGEPLHRAAWVEDTGELYLVRAGGPRGRDHGRGGRASAGRRTPGRGDRGSSARRCTAVAGN